MNLPIMNLKTLIVFLLITSIISEVISATIDAEDIDTKNSKTNSKNLSTKTALVKTKLATEVVSPLKTGKLMIRQFENRSKTRNLESRVTTAGYRASSLIAKVKSHNKSDLAIHFQKRLFVANKQPEIMNCRKAKGVVKRSFERKKHSEHQSNNFRTVRSKTRVPLQKISHVTRLSKRHSYDRFVLENYFESF